MNKLEPGEAADLTASGEKHFHAEELGRMPAQQVPCRWPACEEDTDCMNGCKPKPVPGLIPPQGAETRFITEADQEYADGLLEDLRDDGLDRRDAAQWFCKARVENERRWRKSIPAAKAAPCPKAQLAHDFPIYGKGFQDGHAHALSSPQPSAGMREGLHPVTAKLVDDFSNALAQKLRAAEIKYDYSTGWQDDDWHLECRAGLIKHVMKGDPLDVAAFAAFCWSRGWNTAPVHPSHEHEVLPTFEDWADAMLIGEPDREIFRRDLLAALSPQETPSPVASMGREVRTTGDSFESLSLTADAIWNAREAYLNSIGTPLEEHCHQTLADTLWNDKGGIALAFRELVDRRAALASSPQGQDHSPAGSAPWTCCHCDAPLSCSACGVEQPDDSEHYRQKDAEIEQLRAFVRQVAGHEMSDNQNIKRAKELCAAFSSTTCRRPDETGDEYEARSGFVPPQERT